MTQAVGAGWIESAQTPAGGMLEWVRMAGRDVPSSGGEFVSEAITPDAATFDASTMARGRPGLPTGFTWRGRHYQIRGVLAEWKHSEAEGHRPGGERYYRKHYFRVVTDSGEVMTIYAVRHTKQGENPRKRWWLYTIEQRDGAADESVGSPID